MVEVDQLIGSDSSSAGRSHTELSGVQEAGGLAGAVAVDKRLFLRVADTTGKLGSQIGLDVEDGVVQQLLGDLDHGTQLVGTDGDLGEGVIGFLVRAFLVHPGSGTVGGHNRDLAIAGSGLNHMGQSAEDVVLGQAGNQSTLELIGNQIAAFGVGADLKGIHDGTVRVLHAHGIPEVLLVLIGSATGLVLSIGILGLSSDGGVHGQGHLTLHGIQALLALDLVAQVNDLLLHLLVGVGILSGKDALLVAVGVQEGLRGIPGLCTLRTQLVNLVLRHN